MLLLARDPDGYMSDSDENLLDAELTGNGINGDASSVHVNGSTLHHEQLPARHGRFLESFEQYRDSEGWLQHIAEDIGWTIDEVEQHAFRYLVALVEIDQRRGTTINGRTESRTSQSLGVDIMNGAHGSRPWSVQECALLETLIAVHRPYIREVSQGDRRWQDFIVSQMPGRSESEVLSRIRWLERQY
jgi:hypothetical protein